MPNQLTDDYKQIPAETLKDLVRYVLDGNTYGHFLAALVSNDLEGAYRRADLVHVGAMWALAKFMYNRMPAGSHGSQAYAAGWKKSGGLRNNYTQHELDVFVENMLRDTVLQGWKP